MKRDELIEDNFCKLEMPSKQVPYVDRDALLLQKAKDDMNVYLLSRFHLLNAR